VDVPVPRRGKRQLALVYKAELFNAPRMEAMLRQVANALERVAADATTTVGALAPIVRLLDSRQRAQDY
jgi:hypothetical protein